MQNFREMSHTGNTALINEQIMQSAPSVFATGAHEDVSDRYGFLPTINMIEALRSEGWQVVDATQKNVRKAGNETFTKHLVRFRRLENELKIGDSVAELLLTNSHDRTSSYVLHAGLFRMACANGIVIADETFKKVSVRHSLFSRDEIIEGSYQLIQELPKIAWSVESMQDIELNGMERNILANVVRDHVFGDIENIHTSDENINAQLLRPRRGSDMKHDLWTTFNVIQENVIKGGIKTLRTGKNGYRRDTTRAVKAIDKDIKLNKALWSMAEQMRALKS